MSGNKSKSKAMQVEISCEAGFRLAPYTTRAKNPKERGEEIASSTIGHPSDETNPKRDRLFVPFS